MKKLYALFILTFLVSTFAYAQEALSKRTEEYCQLRTANKLLSRKMVAQVDFGEGADVLKNEQGKPIEFLSTVGALNYMHNKGWVLINSHVEVEGESSYTYYIMKRKTKQE